MGRSKVGPARRNNKLTKACGLNRGGRTYDQTDMYQVIDVPDNAATLVEQVGTKRKFWFDEQRRLFKEGRPGTGENWAEVIGSRLGNRVGVPHADYDFARWKGRQGVVTKNVALNGRLVLGNELLPKVYGEYDGTKRYRQTQYSLGRVRAALRGSEPPLGWQRPAEISSAVDVFVGYLMFDAWIGNQDRHHENWGLILFGDGQRYLAPTFDHAAGFGRNEPDDRRLSRLRTKDQGYSVLAYAERAQSPFYPSSGVGVPISTVDAFRELAHHRPKAARYWLGMLTVLESEQIRDVFDEVPGELITSAAIEFAMRLLDINRLRLLQCL